MATSLDEADALKEITTKLNKNMSLINGKNIT